MEGITESFSKELTTVIRYLTSTQIKQIVGLLRETYKMDQLREIFA